MPRTDLTDITVVLDRSGSMQTIRTDAIGSFNAFISKTAADPGEARLTLNQFDDQFETLGTAVDLKAVVPLTEKTFEPRGSTALYDAICRAIDETGERLAKTPEDQRAGLVVFVILTDGYENASQKFTIGDVNRRIAAQRDTYKWQFIYLGANQDAIAEAGKLGISAGRAMAFAANSAGVIGTANALHTNLRNTRVAYSNTGDLTGAVASMDWTDDQRKEQEEAAKK